jgi:ectoine hydrolase
MTFARAEFDDRLVRTRSRMAAQGIDRLVVVEPANINYLTGYDAWSFYTPQALVISGEERLFITRAMDLPGVTMTTDLAPDEVVAYPDEYVHQRGRHPFEVLAETLRQRGWDSGVIGLERDAYFFSPRAEAALTAGLGSATFRDSDELVNWVRAVKSPAEIDAMRVAAKIVERVMATAIDAVEAGVRQCDAAAEISRAQIQGLDEAGGEYPAIVPMLPTGAGTTTPHLTWSDQPFVEGEATVLELAGTHRRYHVPLARTVFLGQPPAELERLAEVVAEGAEAALATVRPGVTCEEVEGAWRATIGRYGLQKPSRIGYSVGIGYPPDWGEHTMSLRPGDRTPLAVGMTFHMILGMWQEQIGFELSETFCVTDQGAEPFTSVPRRLFGKR